jgi:uncharacterized damage-inducible protein DinB
MALSQAFAAELKQEAATTRRLLERVPQDKFDWKPHDKSMTLGRLAGHVAELPNLITFTMAGDEIDFATRQYKPYAPASTAELAETFDKNVDRALESLNNQSDDQLQKTWRLRSGEQIFLEIPKKAALRNVGLNHLIHHRGQLSVYLRLLEVPVPSIYGPSADEQIFG